MCLPSLGRSPALTSDDLPQPEGPKIRPTLNVRSGSICSILRFQNRMLSGSPSRSRGPGSNSRKKSASCSSKDRSPFGTILIGRPSESDGLDVAGSGADSSVDPGGVLMGADGARGETAPTVVWRNDRKSSAMSLAVLYRSDARFESAFWQI